MTTTTTGQPTIAVHLRPSDIDRELRADVLAGLTRTPKELPPRWLYDERGCELFDEITELAEYYPTRTERAILVEHAEEIAALTGANTLVELGSGTSEKTRLLLDALRDAGTLRRFVGFDVAEPVLREAANTIVEEYPGVEVAAVVGDFHRHLGHIPGGGRRLVAFLGGTIGNLQPDERAALLVELASLMVPGDSLLLGTDLVKDSRRLIAAYDDAAGVTAAFNRNVLSVLNRELGADFDIARFDHVADYDDQREHIEMLLRSRVDQVVHIAGLGIDVTFAAGEDLRTEISAKLRPAGVRAELTAAGLTPTGWWTDADGDYGLSLATR
ncbi:MAG: L-histidine N(alpha)-methyltransferase [Acidimicrobiales bacterium]